jgi:hypothetical protein
MRMLPAPSSNHVRLVEPESHLGLLSAEVGTRPEVWKFISAQPTSTKHSYAARLLLALVVYEDYLLFPSEDDKRER